MTEGILLSSNSTTSLAKSGHGHQFVAKERLKRRMVLFWCWNRYQRTLQIFDE